MQRQAHFLEVNHLQHQMKHVRNYLKGVWDIITFLSILAASNDTCKDKLIFWKTFTASNDTGKGLFVWGLGHNNFS